jgi:hypothetical protein
MRYQKAEPAMALPFYLSNCIYPTYSNFGRLQKSGDIISGIGQVTFK